MSSDQKQRNRIRFQQEQIEWLESQFPEITMLSTPEELTYHAGQRSVLARIKTETQVEVRIVPVRRGL